MTAFILPSILCAAALAGAFVRRFPSAAAAYAAMAVAGATGAAHFAQNQYWFWGIAALIVTMNMYMAQQPPLRALRLYTAGGALAGCCIGALTGTTAGLILCGLGGAFLGFEAFRRTPAGRMNATVAQRLAIFAGMALPPAVTFFIVIITIAQCPVFQR